MSGCLGDTGLSLLMRGVTCVLYSNYRKQTLPCVCDPEINLTQMWYPGPIRRVSGTFCQLGEAPCFVL